MGPLFILSALFVTASLIAIFFFLKAQKIAQRNKMIAQEFEGLNKKLEANISYARQIASGDFTIIEHLENDDELGKSLVEMSSNLKSAEVEEKKRSWSMAGLTKLAEIIRVSNHDLTGLSDNLIVFLVKYMEANQGGLFVVNETDPDNVFLDLKACYAYERKKYIDRKIAVGEGLLGQAVQENDTIYLTEIPKDYVNITSGLGEATPKSLIIVPLKTEDSVVGAIEIASFKVFEPYEREFLEKASQSIASSILASRINENTSKLLKDSQELTEQLRQQEEEVRQNMEEMQATQEEMLNKERQISRLLEESKAKEVLLEEKMAENKRLEEENIRQTSSMLKEIEYNRQVMTQVMNKLPQKIFLKNEEGRFLLLNQTVANDLNKTIDDLLGKNDFDLFSKEDATKFWKAEKEEVLDKLNQIAHYEDFEVDGVRKYFYSIKMPFKFPESEIHGILGYQSDITELKNLENRIKNAEAEMLQKQEELLQEIKRKQEIIDDLQKKLNKK